MALWPSGGPQCTIHPTQTQESSGQSSHFCHFHNMTAIRDPHTTGSGDRLVRISTRFSIFDCPGLVLDFSKCSVLVRTAWSRIQLIAITWVQKLSISSGDITSCTYNCKLIISEDKSMIYICLIHLEFNLKEKRRSKAPFSLVRPFLHFSSSQKGWKSSQKIRLRGIEIILRIIRTKRLNSKCSKLGL